MATASGGTLLSDLDNPSGNASAADGDLVQRILSDMNTGPVPTRGMGAPPPPLPAASPPGGYSMAPNTTMPQTIDAMTAQAHVIGRDHPTPADFAAAIHGVGNRFESYLPQQPSFQQPQQFAEPKKNLYGKLLDEMRTPLVVAFVFFMISLPAINLLFAHYIPYLVLPTGSLTTFGLAIKSILAGLFFWLLQRVIAPLLNQA